LGTPRASPASSQQTSPRARWTKDLNITIMRAFYRVTKMETDMTRYQQRMHAEWLKTQPDDCTTTKTQLANQLAAIRKRGLLVTAELENIKQRVREELSRAAEEQPGPAEPELVDLASDSEEEAQLQEEDLVGEASMTAEQLPVNWQDEYEAMKLNYHHIPPELRPRIPRVEYKGWTVLAVQAVDRLLLPDLEEAKDLDEVVSLVSCAALAVAKGLGKPIKDQSAPTRKLRKVPPKDMEPPWKKRLEAKISAGRRDIGVLTAFLQDPKKATKKLKVRARDIVRANQMKPKDEEKDKAGGCRCRRRHKVAKGDFKKDFQLVLERLKQRVAALASRIRRYNKSAKRKEANQQFAADQRAFYRKLGGEQEQKVGPTAEAMERFWGAIWSDAKGHNADAYWIAEEEQRCQQIPEMADPLITLPLVQSVVKRMLNWKAPGPDGIQNYWWKSFKSTHAVLASWFQKALSDPTVIPRSFTQGITFMLPKPGDPTDPKNRRPITCLQTVYKIFTAVVGGLMTAHLEGNRLLAPEQNGCRRGAQGCKELLVVDSAVVNQARKKKRNISVAWIDYKKAFDSVPHSWLLEVLRLYRVNSQIIALLKHCMATWRTRLKVAGGSCKTGEIYIKRGIFQGDSLSPSWFCLALNPLSSMLRETRTGYQICKNPRTLVNHQFYVDDLKLYATSKAQLGSQLETVKTFSDDIRMEFGLDKCAVVHAVKGQVVDHDAVILMCGTAIQALGKDDSYKYLGIHQLLGTNVTEVRKQVQKKVLERVIKLCKADIHGKNLSMAINSWALPVAVYTFGVLSWSTSSLQEFDQKIRTTMSKFKVHFPRSSLARFYLPRGEGGRGLLNLEAMCFAQVANLRHYFQASQSFLHRALCQVDDGLTPLSLAKDEVRLQLVTREDRRAEWRSKAVHGRFPAALDDEAVDKRASAAWLATSGLFAETESFVFSMQDEVVPTRGYQRHIIGDTSVLDVCRLCKRPGESIQHVLAGCPVLSLTDYLVRHNEAAKVVHQALARRSGFVEREVPYFRARPETVLENDRYKLLWDMPITTDRAVEANRPDMVWVDRVAKKGFIIDMAAPLDKNIVATMAEKRRKYHPLAIEIRDAWRLKAVEVVPLVISVNGLVPKELAQAAKTLNLSKWHTQTMQKAVILGSARIVRKFLGTSA
jgi:Reverse transcriptase (RNA-dependent DNA polymerase)